MPTGKRAPRATTNDQASAATPSHVSKMVAGRAGPILYQDNLDSCQAEVRANADALLAAYDAERRSASRHPRHGWRDSEDHVQDAMLGFVLGRAGGIGRGGELRAIRGLTRRRRIDHYRDERRRADLLIEQHDVVRLELGWKEESR